jgi:hypothetical protein
MAVSMGTTSEVEYKAPENHIHTLALAYLERRSQDMIFALR